MKMSNETIVMRYTMAKESYRKQRLVELADENNCSVQTIKDILLANGVPADEIPRGKGRPPKQVQKIPPVIAPAEKRVIEPPKAEIKLPEPEKVEVPLVQVEIKEPPIMVAVDDELVKEVLPKEEPKLEKIPITVLNVAADTPSPISQMIAGLNTDTQKLKDEIERKQQLLAATEKAYVALKELETIVNGEQ